MVFRQAVGFSSIGAWELAKNIAARHPEDGRDYLSNESRAKAHSRTSQFVARASSAAGGGESLELGEGLEVAGGGGFGGAGEGGVFAGVHTTGEAFGAGIEHAADDLELASVQHAVETLEEERFP